MSYFKTWKGTFFEFENVICVHHQVHSIMVVLFGAYSVEIDNPEDMESFKEKFKEFLNAKYSEEEKEVVAEDVL